MKISHWIMVAAVAASTVFTSCQSPLVGSNSGNGPASASIESTRYAQNVVSAYRHFSSDAARSAGTAATETTDSIVRYFEEYPMTDADGNTVDFTQLTVEQKDFFLNQWQTQTAAQIQESIEDTPTLVEDLKATNDAFSRSLNEVRSTSGTEADFSKSLSRSISTSGRLAPNVGTARNSSGTGGYAMSQNAANLLASKYVKANAISGFAASNDTANYFGHAALFSEAAWNPAWLNNPDSQFTISATGGRGVCRENFSDWTNKNNWIKTIKVLTPKYTYWQWTGPWYWPTGEWRTSYPNSSDRTRAVTNAASLLGKPYNWNFLDRDNRSAYYCSQVVYRSWYDVNSNYDFHSGIWALSVTPADLVNSDRSQTTGTANVD